MSTGQALLGTSSLDLLSVDGRQEVGTFGHRGSNVAVRFYDNNDPITGAYQVGLSNNAFTINKFTTIGDTVIGIGTDRPIISRGLDVAADINIGGSILQGGAPYIMPITNGGTGSNVAPSQGGVIYGSSTTSYASTVTGTIGQALVSKGAAAPAWEKIGLTTHVTGTLGVGSGGTGATSEAVQGGIIYGASTSAYASTVAGTSGQPLISAGTGTPAFGTLGVAGGGTGNTTYAVGDILYASGTAALSRVAQTATGSALVSKGAAAPAWEKIGLTTHVTGILGIGSGGTGATSEAVQGGIIYGASTSAYASTVAGTSGQPLISAGTGTPAFGTLGVAGGGTGNTTYAVGDILYASGTAALSRVAQTATGSALVSKGAAAPAWEKIGLTTHVTGTLPIANGGTNATTTIANGVVFGASTTAYSTTAAGTSGQAFVSNGASSAPSFQTLTLENLPNASFKRSVKAGTIGDLSAASFTATTITGTAVVFPLQDGIQINLGNAATNERLLVKNQTNALQNGIYTLTTAGVAGTIAWVLTRTPDADTPDKLAGAIVNIDSGTTQGGQLWTTTFKSTDVINTNTINWSRVLDSSSTHSSVVHVATTGANITLAGGAPNTLDGITLQVNDRVLVKDQTAAEQNGIYTVITLGTGANGTWTRSIDADTIEEAFTTSVAVGKGTQHGGKVFNSKLKSDQVLGAGTSPMYWSKVIDLHSSSRAALQTTGRGLDIDTMNDPVTMDTGAVADLALNAFNPRAISAVASSTYTTASTVFISGPPTASTNAIITTPYALNVNSGNVRCAGTLTMGNTFKPATGTATIAPIHMTTGVLLTTPLDGVIEKDALAFYGTTSTHGRGVIPSVLFTTGLGPGTTTIVLNTLYPIFPTPNDVLTLAAATYRFNGVIGVQATNTTNAVTLKLSMRGTGTATISSIQYSAIATNANAVTASAATLARITTPETVAATVPTMPDITVGVNSSTNRTVQIEGIMRVTAGTIIPSVGFGTTLALNGALTFFANNYMEFFPIGGSAVVSSGAWS